MLAILPLITLFLLFLLWDKPDRDWRISYLSSVVILGSLIAVSSELLTVISSLNFPMLLSFWLLTNGILAGYYYKKFKTKKQVFPSFQIPKLSLLSWLILWGILVIILLVGLAAIIGPPNNWDSMTYHMARVMHWIQNESLAHYPTYSPAQLVHPPFAEIIIMHLQILSGGDRLANLVQWWAMVSSIIGVSLISKQLGVKEEGQLLAAAFCATLPMGILQGSSTQNDYAVTLFVVCLAYYTLVLVANNVISWSVLLAIASSFGLALYTKSSAYFFCFPFMVWLTLWLWQQKRWKSWKYLTTVMLIALCFNLAHYSRNLEVFGSPISAKDYQAEYQNSVHSLPTLISSVIRHLSFHSDIVRYFHLQDFITPITGKVEKLVYLIHEYILKVDPNDTRITMPGYTYRVPGLSFNEDVAVNPFHLFLILLAIVIFIVTKKIINEPIARNYLMSIITSFLLFSLLLKLQPYSVRLHLSLFVLFSPLIGLCYSPLLKPKILKVLTFILIITCIPWLFNNNFRPLVGEKSILNMSRNDMYFMQRADLRDIYSETVNRVNQQGCTNIGLALAWDTIATRVWEYPLWILMSEVNPDQDYRFSHFVTPKNFSAKLMEKSPHNSFEYCALIAIKSSETQSNQEIKLNNQFFIKDWSRPPVDILLPKK